MKHIFYETHVKPLRYVKNFLLLHDLSEELTDFEIKWMKKKINESTRAYKDNPLIIRGKKEVYAHIKEGNILLTAIWLNALINTVKKQA